MIEQEPISLFELNKSIQLELKSSFDYAYWVVAEINEHTENYSGHCYLELVEKDNTSEKIIAKARGTIWAGTYRKLLPYFETTARHAFGPGIKVMIRVTVEFHELYGLSLNVIDIDPAYTLGDLQQQKQQAIEKLKAEGVFDMNKEIPLPEVIQKIAVISSKTAAGLGDFINQLDNNSNSTVFYHKLFPAVMQGENAEQSVIDALEQIYVYEDFFDAVVIIRGGGSKTDLSCFDKYWLAYHVAQFPLPVLTGIGHEQDDTVTDMVANTRLKTPTAVASFIIEKAVSYEENLDNLFFNFKDILMGTLNERKQHLFKISSSLNTRVKLSLANKKELMNALSVKTKNNVNKYFKGHQNSIGALVKDIKHSAKNKIKLNETSLNSYKSVSIFYLKNYIRNKQRKMGAFERLNNAFDPQNVLNRGYSITYKNGGLLTSDTGVSVGDQIETRLKSGKIASKITKNNT